MEQSKRTSTEANKKWQKQNKEYNNYLKARSMARGFIRNRAKEEDLLELEEMIKTRREEIGEL